jgi:hypothetical protein
MASRASSSFLIYRRQVESICGPTVLNNSNCAALLPSLHSSNIIVRFFNAFAPIRLLNYKRVASFHKKSIPLISLSICFLHTWGGIEEGIERCNMPRLSGSALYLKKIGIRPSHKGWPSVSGPKWVVKTKRNMKSCASRARCSSDTATRHAIARLTGVGCKPTRGLA